MQLVWQAEACHGELLSAAPMILGVPLLNLLEHQLDWIEMILVIRIEICLKMFKNVKFSETQFS